MASAQLGGPLRPLFAYISLGLTALGGVGIRSSWEWESCLQTIGWLFLSPVHNWRKIILVIATT